MQVQNVIGMSVCLSVFIFEVIANFIRTTDYRSGQTNHIRCAST